MSIVTARPHFPQLTLHPCQSNEISVYNFGELTPIPESNFRKRCKSACDFAGGVLGFIAAGIITGTLTRAFNWSQNAFLTSEHNAFPFTKTGAAVFAATTFGTGLASFVTTGNVRGWVAEKITIQIPIHKRITDLSIQELRYIAHTLIKDQETQYKAISIDKANHPFNQWITQNLQRYFSKNTMTLLQAERVSYLHNQSLQLLAPMNIKNSHNLYLVIQHFRHYLETCADPDKLTHCLNKLFEKLPEREKNIEEAFLQYVFISDREALKKHLIDMSATYIALQQFFQQPNPHQTHGW